MGDAIAAAASAISAAAPAIKAVASVASVAIGIYEVVEGDTTKGLAMIAGGAMLGVDAAGDMQSSDVSSSIDMANETGGALSSYSLSASDALKPSSFASEGIASGGTNQSFQGLQQTGLLSSANSDNGFSAASNKVLNDSLGSTSSFKGGESIAKPVAQSNVTGSNLSGNTTTSGGSKVKGGLLASVGNFIKDNKEMVSMVGGALQSNDQQKFVAEQADKNRAQSAAELQFAKDKYNNNTLGTIPATAGVTHGFDKTTGKYL